MKTKMKKLITLVMVLILALSLGACGSTETPVSSNEAEGESKEVSDVKETPGDADKFTIGWSVYFMENEFFQYIDDGVQAKADELGINVIFHDQKNDEAEMVSGVQNLISQDIDALVITPCKPEVMSNIVELAHEKDIPVIIVDIGDGGSDKDAIIISDVYGGGEMAGRYALELIEEKGITSKNAAIIKCEESAIYAIRRGEGFKSVMESNDYTIVAELTANSMQDQGYAAMQDILASQGEDIAVVFAENDPMAAGAGQAIEEAGLAGKILVLGFNGDEIALESITEGIMQGTIAQDPYGMGALGVELAQTLMTGGTLTYDSDSTKEIYADVYLIDQTGSKQE